MPSSAPTPLRWPRCRTLATAKGAPPRWTGLVKDGKLLGQNLMGELMMEARATLRREVQEEQEDGPQAKRVKTE